MREFLHALPDRPLRPTAKRAMPRRTPRSSPREEHGTGGGRCAAVVVEPVETLDGFTACQVGNGAREFQACPELVS